MKLRKIFVAALMLLGTTAMVAQPMQLPPIPVDPAVRIGKLDNGLTYYIRHNEYPALSTSRATALSSSPARWASSSAAT